MANTYSSREYSQGPILYIDSSGFEKIDDNKNFTYFYIVTYGPVEYKRKITNDKGESSYEYKYSFGTSNADRKTLGRYTFTGKNQVTKTVTHSAIEDGFKRSITKTFVIDTNIQSNIQSNQQSSINTKEKFDTSNWSFPSLSSSKKPNIGSNYFGWVTVKETGYRTETYYTRETRWEFGIVDWEWYYLLVEHGEDYTKFPIYNWYEVTYWEPHSEYVSYTYNEVYNSYAKLDLTTIKQKLNEYKEYASMILVVKTKNAVSCPPDIYMDSGTSQTSKRTKLIPKTSGNVSAGSLIEYYVPTTLISNTFANNSSVYIHVNKGNSSTKDCYLIEGYVCFEIESSGLPYINLKFQAYDAAKDAWIDACTIPYLDHEEIKELRENKSNISKNLFIPSDLPKTDSTYRIKLDTNMVAQEAERLTNFRMDLLFNQQIAPNSITDQKLYVENSSLDYKNELELGKIDEVKLNALGSMTYNKKPNMGFLRKGANDIHAYLKSIDFTVPEEADSYTYNKWFNCIENKNGNWISSTIFATNTLNFVQTNILKANNVDDNVLTFKVPYKDLESNAKYELVFDINAQKDSFYIADVNTVNESDKSKIVSARVYTTSSYDKNKVTIKDINTILYTPHYKLKSGSNTTFIDEYDRRGNNDIEVKIEINTKTIPKNDTGYLTIKINRSAIRNLFIKNIKGRCITANNKKIVDIFNPFNAENDISKKNEIVMTLYYDGINLKHINPLKYQDMVYLRQELDKIRKQFGLSQYPWSEWVNKSTSVDKENHMLGVNKGQPLRAKHFNDVKSCCVDTYEKLVSLQPPVNLNVSPTTLRNDIKLIQLKNTNNYVLQHYKDQDGKLMSVDEFFPEWRKIIDLLNRN